MDVILTLAEIAVALAGFASVAAVFSSRGRQHWDPVFRARITGLLEIGLSTLLLAVVPLAPHYLGFRDELAWAAGSLFFAFWLGPLFVYWFLARDLPLARSGQLRLGFGFGFYPMCAGMVILQAANAFGAFSDHRFGIFLVGVLWGLVATAGMFLLLITATEPE